MKFIAIAVVAIATVSIPTRAQATPCIAVSGERPVLSMDDRDEDYLRGLRLGLMFGLTPTTFPQEQIAAAADACTRGEFEATAEIYHVFGDDFDTPQRWAVGSSSDRIAYLALMPPPADTLEWARRGARGPISFTGESLYALAIVNGDTRDVFAIFDGMPGDAQLATAFKDAIEGRLPRIAIFDPSTGETQFADRHSL
jgi:hypothetical protein